MGNNSLTWFLEINKITTNFQCDLRKQKNSMDHLVHLETFIRDVFIKREHISTAVINLENVYDVCGNIVA